MSTFILIQTTHPNKQDIMAFLVGALALIGSIGAWLRFFHLIHYEWSTLLWFFSPYMVTNSIAQAILIYTITKAYFKKIPINLIIKQIQTTFLEEASNVLGFIGTVLIILKLTYLLNISWGVIFCFFGPYIVLNLHSLILLFRKQN